MDSFVHLHLHTDYSLLRASGTIPEYASRASELGMSALALSDYGNLFGAVRFYNECREAGIKPIIGSEFYLADGSRHEREADRQGRYARIVLLAKSMRGYKNLMLLSSVGYTEGFYYKPRIDDEALAKHNEDLVCLSGSLAGDIPRLIMANRREDAVRRAEWYREIFGPKGFYLEIMDHGIPDERTVNRALVEISGETGIPLVATNDCHYVRKEDANAHDILMCIGNGRKKHETARPRMFNAEYYLKSGEQMAELFTDLPEEKRHEALANTARIAEACNTEIPQPGPLLPIYEVPEEFEGPNAYLRHLTYEGLRRRYPEITEEISSRADYELETIIGMDYTGYFLIVWDFIRFAKDRSIPVGPGRGSGAGSIVAYALEITDIDPLAYGLLFERFLNPDRVNMPDFDIDFCYERRGEVIEYVTRKYGSDRVGQIITFGTLKAKAVIRDVARVLDLSFAEADRIAKLVPGDAKSLDAALEEEPELAAVRDQGGAYRELIEVSRNLEGLCRHASTHAAGIVIGKEKLTEYVPLYRDPRTESISTQYTMDEIEPCGLVKMDFLGLKTLTLIRNCEELIRRHTPDFDIEEISTDDAATFRMLGEGKSACVFQFESSGMQDILRRALPNSINDLIALNSLYRPGPMDNIPQFVDSKRGRTPIQYPHPLLKEVLEETYGVIVYQEQVMEIVRIIGGFSLGQADILRRAMGKKKIKEMERMRLQFLEGARERGLPEEKANEIFELLRPFAGYGFNKSHAAAYSVVAYKTAYLKANYPAEFMAANLTNEISNPDKFAEYLSETRRMKIRIEPPDVNRSGKYFTVVDGIIYYGLQGIKNVGGAAVDAILAERDSGGPYESFTGFLDRVDMRTVNRKVIETMIQVGVFDSLEPRRATLLANLDRLIADVSAQKKGRQAGQTSLFDGTDEFDPLAIELEEVEEWSTEERLAYEKEILGFYCSGHPLDEYRDRYRACATASLEHALEASEEREHVLVGLIHGVRTVVTKRDTRMAFAMLEDYTGSIELVIFAEPLQAAEHLLADGTVVGMVGSVDRSRGRTQFVVKEIRRPEELEELDRGEVHIRLAPDAVLDEEELCTLRGSLKDFEGSCPVYLHVPRNGEDEMLVRASGQLTVSSKSEILNRIRELPQVAEAWKKDPAGATDRP